MIRNGNAPRISNVHSQQLARFEFGFTQAEVMAELVDVGGAHLFGGHGTSSSAAASIVRYSDRGISFAPKRARWSV